MRLRALVFHRMCGTVGDHESSSFKFKIDKLRSWSRRSAEANGYLWRLKRQLEVSGTLKCLLEVSETPKCLLEVSETLKCLLEVVEK